MKSKKLSPFIFSAVASAFLMLLFTFLQWGWFSDKGLDAFFQIPVSTKKEGLDLFADLIWMAAPFSLIVGLFLPRNTKPLRVLSMGCACLPLTLYSLFQILLFLGEKEGHFSLLITYFFLILCGILTVASVFLPELRRFAAQLLWVYAGAELLLLILSFIFQEKYSQFYFSQLLPVGHYSHFRYSFFLISLFLYYLTYTIALISLLSETNERKTATSLKEVKTLENSKEAETKTESEEPETENTEDAPLSLEDFGIER